MRRSTRTDAAIVMAGGMAAVLALLAGIPPATVAPRVPERGLYGWVVGADGRAIAGADVEIWRRESAGSVRVATTRSDETGFFVLERPPHEAERGAWVRDADRIEAPAPGCAVSVVQGLGGLHAASIGTLFLFPPVRVEGRVTDAGGAPVAGARVRAFRDPAPSRHSDTMASPPVASTDALGRFAFTTLGPGRACIGVEADGFRDREMREVVLSATEPNDLDVVLEPSPAVTVRVVDEEGRPIAGAEVEMDDLACWREPVRTDAQGVARVEGLRPGMRRAPIVRARGFGERAFSYEEWTREPTYVLDRGVPIFVRARRAEDGAAIALRSVEVREAHGDNTCGSFEPSLWKRLEPSDPEVVVVDPSTWRIHWRGPRARRGGERVPPSRLVAVDEEGLRSVAVELPWDEPWDGEPFERTAWFEAARFEPEPAPLRSCTVARHGLLALRGSDAPPPRRVVGRLTIDGRSPGVPIAVALRRASDVEMHPDRYESALAVVASDTRGRFSFDAPSAGRYRIVPQHPFGAEAGAARDLAIELSVGACAGRDRVIDVPERGDASVAIDLARRSAP